MVSLRWFMRIPGSLKLALVSLVGFAVAGSGRDQPKAAKIASSCERLARNWASFRRSGQRYLNYRANRKNIREAAVVYYLSLGLLS